MSRTVVPAVTLPPLLPAVLLWRNPIGQLSRWSRRHGDLFTVCLASTGEVVVVGDPSVADQILTSDPALSRTGSATGRVLPLLGEACVLRQDGDPHRQRRRLLNTVFHGDSVTSRKELITALVDRELDTWASGQALAALPVMQNITFAVIADLSSDSTTRPGSATCTTRCAACRALRRWPGRGCRRSPMAGSATPRVIAGSGGAALSLLLAAHPAGGGDPPTHEDPAGNIHPLAEAPADNWLSQELLALLMVGHETTATALGWAVERLARQPETARRLARSLDDGEDSYLSAFISEVLRWRPRWSMLSGSSLSLQPCWDTDYRPGRWSWSLRAGPPQPGQLPTASRLPT